MEERFELDPEVGPSLPAHEPGLRRGGRSQGHTETPIKEVHFLDYVKVIYKRRWTAAAVFLMVSLSCLLYAFLATPIYEGQARLLIESDENNVVAFEQVVDQDQTKPDYYQTQYSILRSRALAKRTLEAMKLWDSPHFNGAAAQSSVHRVVGAIAGIFRGRAADEVSTPEADETFAQSSAIDRFLDRLTISPIRNSRLVDIRFRLSDPALAASITNTLAKGYIEQNLEYKFLASKEAGDWLSERLKEQRLEVERAEGALQRYREQNDAISLQDRENIVVQKLSDLNAAVTRAKTERINKEALYNQLRANQANATALDTFPAILGNSFIQQQKSELAALQQQQAQLAEKFGDKHPDMQRVRSSIQLAQSKLNAETAKIVQSVKSEYDAALSQEQSLAAALNAQKDEALSMNRKGIEYSVLERDVESTKQIYNSLLQRAKETGVSGELKTSNIRVVDSAERPRSPVTPNRPLNLFIGFFGGALLACLGVFFLEYVDSRINTPDDIKLHLGLSHLGLLPAARMRSAGDRALISEGVPANFAEAIRALRTNVLFSLASEGSRSLVVTSTGPGEGKSLVASNLAVAIAQSGRRVLLMDADMRKPKMHEAFGLEQEPGLSNLLVGSAKASDAVRKSGVPGLWIISAGRTPPNPAELLGSQRLRDFMTSLKDHFDWIVIDTPPVMAVTDASLVAHYASGVLFVVGADMTSRHAARRAVEQLAQVEATFLGGVLNRADLDKNPYYYSQYYRAEYSTYYSPATGAK